MNARPMIIGTKIWPALFGLRPIDSIAEAAIRPCPSALPNAAIPMPMFAAIAINPARSGAPVSPPAASCAIASSGDARMAIPAIVTIVPILCRNISILLLFRAPRVPWAGHLSSSTTSNSGRNPWHEKSLLMVVACGESNVTHRKDHEDDSLDHAYDRPERVEREPHQQAGPGAQETEHGMVGEHVGVETNAERKGTEQIIGQLDRQHQHRQRQVRAEKTLKVPDAVRGEALVDVVAEADDAEGKGQVGVAGRRLHPGDQPEEVREQDEHEDRSKERDHRRRPKIGRAS